MIYNTITELIGKTPLVKLSNYTAQQGLTAQIIAKLESLNPAGSVKDRVALAMITDAEQKGLLSKGSVIIEPTSGNTGIGLAMVAATRGYRVILTMPETMSVERRSLLQAYGAEIILTPGARGMAGAVEAARELAAQTPGAFMPGQFDNPANPAAHQSSTGPEIWEDTGGRLDIFVAGVGTGGTVSGVGAFLKSKKADLHVAAVEPLDSPMLSKGCAGLHGLQGIGAGFVPGILDTGIYNEVVTVSYDDAVSACRAAARLEGILAGISSGAALHAAAQLARRPGNEGATIVVLFPDTGERYLSASIF